MSQKKYTTVDDLNAIGKLLTDFCKENKGFHLVDIVSTTEGASIHSPEDNGQVLTVISLDDPAVGIFGKGLAGASQYIKEQPLHPIHSTGAFRWHFPDKKNMPTQYAMLMGRKEDIETFEKVMDNYRN